MRTKTERELSLTTPGLPHGVKGVPLVAAAAFKGGRERQSSRQTECSHQISLGEEEGFADCASQAQDAARGSMHT